MTNESSRRNVVYHFHSCPRISLKLFSFRSVSRKKVKMPWEKKMQLFVRAVRMYSRRKVPDGGRERRESPASPATGVRLCPRVPGRNRANSGRDRAFACSSVPATSGTSSEENSSEELRRPAATCWSRAGRPRFGFCVRTQQDSAQFQVKASMKTPTVALTAADKKSGAQAKITHLAADFSEEIRIQHV